MGREERELRFIDSFREMSGLVGHTARAKGWWEKDRGDGEIIALMHSELSEALEAMRKGNPPDDKIPEFTGTEVELADVIIRIMDYADNQDLRIAEALVAKAQFNITRSYKHGDKKF